MTDYRPKDKVKAENPNNMTQSVEIDDINAFSEFASEQNNDGEQDYMDKLLNKEGNGGGQTRRLSIKDRFK